MKDVIAKFGTFAGIDANGGDEATSAAFWNSILSAPPWAQRDAWVGARAIPAVGSDGGDKLAGVGMFAARAEWQQIVARAGLSMINNCEVEVKNPVKGITGDDAVISVDTVGTRDDALV